MGVKTIPVEEYVQWLLGNSNHVSASDIPMETDFDYVMSIMLVACYDEDTSFYRLTFEDGEVKKNGYSYPNMTISRCL